MISLIFLGLRKYLFNKEINHFHQNKQDHDPFKHSALSVLHNVFKQVQVFFYNFKTFLDIPKPT